MTRLLQSRLVKPGEPARKYAGEVHDNEIMLLAYYIAAVNVETTYHARTKTEYSPVEGIVLADTFQITEDGDSMDAEMFPQNDSRIIKQLAAPIHVIVGNPPYSAPSGARIGDGTAGSHFIDGVARQPEAQSRLFTPFLKPVKTSAVSLDGVQKWAARSVRSPAPASHRHRGSRSVS